VPTIQGRGSKGQGWLPLNREIGKAGSALRPVQPPSQTSAIAGIRLPRRTSVGATASPVATSMPVVARPTPCKRYTCNITQKYQK
jgi:hypothetical protein